MAPVSAAGVGEFLARCDGAVGPDKGRILEEMISEVFGSVPGLEFYRKDTLNQFRNEEIDVLFYNDIRVTGMTVLGNVLIVECKNWSEPVGAPVIREFRTKLENGMYEAGVLVALNGITGNAQNLQAAHQEIVLARAKGRRILVITRDDLGQVTDSLSVHNLLKSKILELAALGTTA